MSRFRCTWWLTPTNWQSIIKQSLLFLFAFIFAILPLKAEAGTWIPAGGPDGALVKQLAISPNYAIDQTLFAITVPYGGGSTSGSLFKSTNGGTSWNLITTISASQGVTSITLSPNYAIDQTVFITSTIFNGPVLNGAVFKSTDGGGTWSAVNTSLPTIIGPVVTSPNYTVDQTIFLATCGGGILKSINGGASWISVNSGLPSNVCVTSIGLSPNYLSDQVVFIGSTSTIFKSTNGGGSWVQLSNDPLSSGVNRTVVISPNFNVDETLFAFSPNNNNLESLYKSTDGGVTWNPASPSLSGHIQSVAFSPNYSSDQTVFAGMVGLHSSFDTAIGPGIFKSTNGGAAWTAVNTGLTNTEVNSIVVSPNYAVDQTLFAGTYDSEGLFKSTNSGTSWTLANTDLASLLINSVALSPNYPLDHTIFGFSLPFDVAYYGSRSSPGSLFKSTDGGRTWTSVITGITRLNHVRLADLGSVSLSPEYALDQTLFATLYGKSTNGSISWTSLDQGACGRASFVLSPNYTQDQTVFRLTGSCGDVFSIGGGLYKSIDGGNSWGEVLHVEAYSLAFSPNYALDRTLFLGSLAEIYKSTDDGASWIDLNIGLSSSVKVNSLAISPNFSNDQTIFAGTNSWIYKSSDGGASWIPVNTGLTCGSLSNPPVNTIAISPNFANDQTIFAGQEWCGVFKSTDGGTTWNAINTGLPVSDIRSLAISPGYPCDGTLFAGTGGASVWKYTDTEAMASCGVFAPSISSLSPTSGPIGTSVTITGTNFGATQGTSTVTFNGVQATITSWSDTQIVATVQAGATTGPVVVTVNGVASNSDKIFTVLLPDFTLSASPDTQTIVQGSSTSFTVSLGSLNGFNSPVTLSINSDLPSDATASFSPNPVTPPGTSTLTINTSSTTPAGLYTLVIQSDGGGQTHITSVTMTVNIAPSFSLIRLQGDYKAYYVSNGYKYHIPDPETFEVLGFNWGDIKTVTQTEFDSYRVDPYNTELRTGGPKDGSLVRRGNDIKVYLLENGIRRWIPDPNTLYAMGRLFGQVIQFDDNTFANIPEGNPIPSVDSNISDFIAFISETGENCAAYYNMGVNIATGSYTYRKTDLVIPGRGIPFEFSRTYNARNSEDSILGKGWAHSYNITATEVQKKPSGGTTTNLFVRFKWGNGQEEWYQWNGSVYEALYGMHNTLTGGSGANTLTVITKTQVKYVLELVGTDINESQDFVGNKTYMTTNRYRLKSISDRNGNTITLNYSGSLSSITDTVGRSYTAMTDPLGTTMLTKITDAIGRTVEFKYDSDLKLSEVKNPNGGVTKLTYNDKVMGVPSPLIKTVTDPREYPEVSNTYVGYKQTASVKMGVDSPNNFLYSSGVTSVNISPSLLNITRKYAINSKGLVSGVAPTGDLNDKISIDRLDERNPCNPSMITDRLGKQTTLTYDTNGNVLTATDALDNITKFEYTDMNNPNNPTKKIEAYGTSYQRETTYTYDTKGNLITIMAPIGAVNITYTAYGQPQTVMDASDITL